MNHMVIVWSAIILLGVTGILGSLIDMKQDEQIEKDQIDSDRKHWFQTVINCNNMEQISKLNLKDPDEIESNKKLCNGISDAYAILAYRAYGEVFDQQIIDNFIEESGIICDEDGNCYKTTPLSDTGKIK